MAVSQAEKAAKAHHSVSHVARDFFDQQMIDLPNGFVADAIGTQCAFCMRRPIIHLTASFCSETVLKRFPNHSRKGARMFAICRAISLSRGTQSSFPHIIIRTM